MSEDHRRPLLTQDASEVGSRPGHECLILEGFLGFREGQVERTKDKSLRTQLKNAIDRLLGKETAMDYVPDTVFWEDRVDDARDA